MSDQSTSNDIFQRLQAGVPLRKEGPDYHQFQAVVSRTIRLCVAMNASVTEVDEVRQRLSEITGQAIDPSTAIFPPFHTNFGQFIRLGKNVFINHACSFLDIGGITIEDDVQIGPKVNLITENHPLDPADRETLLIQPIVVKQNAWIGAGATIPPGVTVGENAIVAIVAAGAAVSRNVPANTVVAGVPAKVVKTL